MIPLHSKYTRENSELLFHKINWLPYARTSFEKAVKENRPVFLVISAPAWCHWCHVYESEDYLFNEKVYPLINEQFIPIFVDSDKRPDVLKKLEGGWPSTILISPNGVRLFGFSGPCDPAELREHLESVVGQVKKQSFSSAKKPFVAVTSCLVPTKEDLKNVEQSFLSYVFNIFDETFGGLQTPSGQKFPTGLVYDFLLDKYVETNDEKHLKMVQLTFDNQFTDIKDIKKYRLFDPVEGGFHRYSTQSDWSVPHYEKLLCDQAVLIRAYAHLFKVTKDEKVKGVVDASINFVLTKLSTIDGSFYNSQDADKEDAYYCEVDRSKLTPPFIDKTRRIDANCLMTSTFLYLYALEKNELYKTVVLKSLDFLNKKMLTDRGAFFYFDDDKQQSFLTGFSLANAHALLTFIDAFEILKDEQYLIVAQKLADFCLKNLADESGSFFDRKSSEVERYPPNEENDVEKSYAENALFAYAFARLYKIMQEQKYHDVVMKTLGVLLELSPQSLDDVTYLLRAIRLLEK